MKKMFFLSIVFFSNQAMQEDALQTFYKIVQLYKSDDAADQLIFNELYQKCHNTTHEVWPDNLKKNYCYKLSQLEFIDQAGNPKQEVSRIIKGLVKKIHINESSIKYLLIEPNQNTLLYPSLESKRQIGSRLLISLLSRHDLIIDFARANTINNGVLW